MHSSYTDRFRSSLFKYCITAAGLLLAFGIFFGDSVAVAANWPQWLGPLRNGVSDETVEPRQQPPESFGSRQSATALVLQGAQSLFTPL